MKLSRLQQLAGILLNESTLVESSQSRYLEMFRGVINIDPTQSDRVEKLSNEIVAKTRRQFGSREDGIIWALRYERIYLLRNIRVNNKTDFNTKAVERYINDLAQQSGLTYEQVYKSSTEVGTNGFWRIHKRFMSLPIPEIHTYRYKFQSFNEVLEDFSELEHNWILASRSPEVDREDDHTLVMSFPDGMAWWNLNKAVCKAEGDAMDHCGNDAMHDPDDTILSLRSPIENSKKLAPHLTFILDQQGMIGEMKGRNNQKPSKKYYKYIVALLQSDGIRGITGGGYKPENNFSVMDLPESVRTQLVNDKPDLANLETKIKMFGWDDPRIQTQLERVLGEYNIPMVESVEERQVVIKSWDMISDFIREISEHDNVALSILDAIEDVKSDEGQVFNPDDRRSWLQSLRNEMTTYLKNLFEFIISGVILEFDSKSVEVENGKCAVKIWNDEFFETVDALDKYTNSDNFNALDIDDEIVYNAERLMTNKDWLFLEDGDHIDLGDYGVETRMDDSKLAINYWKRKEFEVRVASLDSQQNSTFKEHLINTSVDLDLIKLQQLAGTK